MIRNKKTATIIAMMIIAVTSKAQHNPLLLSYDAPASRWEENLPLGNGRLGMMPDGGIFEETVVLNDITLWSGSEQDANNYEGYQSLSKIRELMFQGKNDEAQALAEKTFTCKGEGSGHGNGANLPFGCYQTLGNLNIQYTYKANAYPPRVTDYQRNLDLQDALATTSFNYGGISYQREYLCSFGHDVEVIKIASGESGLVSCKISLSRPENYSISGKGNILQMHGELPSGTDQPGMKYLAQVEAKNSGGRVWQTDDTLRVENATELVIYISAGTDYKDPYYQNTVEKNLKSAVATYFRIEKEMHINSYRKLFDRVSIDLGAGENSSLLTDRRLEAFYNAPEKDPALPALFFQFGRYLAISSTRPGLLPPNLQGLWANQIQTPWNGDYHLDVNVNMNHWPFEVCNLSELNLPLAELVKGMIQNGHRTARAYYNADGWIAHTITNIWGYAEPGERASWGISQAGSGWICNNLWEHYAFTRDTGYLRSIYPVLVEAARFYNSTLVKDPDTGWLVNGPSCSPENTFYLPNGKTAQLCMGPTIDNQVIRELFNNVITASVVLGVGTSFSDTLADKLAKIPPVAQISQDGSIQEWLKDYKERDPKHRHISHLYGLYPAHQITPETTPTLAEAAKKTLEVRGDGSSNWAMAHKQLFWARLYDGNRAYKLFRELLKPAEGNGDGVYSNMLFGSPFQIDASFGGTAGIAEMLIQSHLRSIDNHTIHLLPALPDAWPDGKVSGLRARGGFELDIAWKNGKLEQATIHAVNGGEFRIYSNGSLSKEFALKKGESMVWKD